MLDDASWLAERNEAWTTELAEESPSSLAERIRYLPASTTNLPGSYSFSTTPFLREVLDCCDVNSPIREVIVMKGAQIGYTVGVLENAFLYWIVHIKNAPCMLVTADDELAQIRLNNYILPMIQASNLSHLIVSSDEGNKRKTGSTNKKLEFAGGGWLIPQGAKSANKLSSVSIRNGAGDECDRWPQLVGKDGDPASLFRTRMAGFPDSRKLLLGSTPNIKGQSLIEAEFKNGDQREYRVRCLNCEWSEALRWERVNPETGERTGMHWELDGDGRLVPGSVYYTFACGCGRKHINEDKKRFLDPANGAQWVPTSVPIAPDIRSYHIPGLLSPPGLEPWEIQVRKWLGAWNVAERKPRDAEKLQVFYNNILGVPFELSGTKVKFERVSQHRRIGVYDYCHDDDGNRKHLVPNRFALEHCGSPILIVFCAVDVQGDWLAVGVFGIARGFRLFLLDYHIFRGDTEDHKCPDTWGKVANLIETRIYEGDDGNRYRPWLSAIDAGYRRDTVFRFVSEYDSGVIATMGREEVKGGNLRHFAPMPAECVAFTIKVDHYKERLSSYLAQQWEGFGLMPEGQFSAPQNASDASLKELTVEERRQKVNAKTGKHEGWLWYRPSGSRNELWDLSVLASALLDMVAHECFPINPQAGRYAVPWAEFWDLCAEGRFMFNG